MAEVIAAEQKNSAIPKPLKVDIFAPGRAFAFCVHITTAIFGGTG
jgi:hypothetical protein